MRRASLFATLAAFAVIGAAVPVTTPTASAQQASSLPDLPGPATALKPQETAIIVVDFQNNFASEKGEHYPRLAEQYKAGHMLEKSVDFVRQARARGILVVHVTEGYTGDYRELDWGTTGTFHRAQILRQAWKSSTWAVDLYEPLKPGPNDKDILLPNRIQASGFAGNGLDYILKSRGIRNVAVLGYNTDICVYATVLSAHDLGYRTYAVSDLMISFRPDFAKEMLDYIYPYWSRVLTSSEFMGLFGGA